MDYHHKSVLLDQSVEILNPRPGGTFIDCTLGGGGHTQALLERSSPDGKVFAFDRDFASISNAQRRLGQYIHNGRLTLNHCPFSQILPIMEKHKMLGQADGILADIGLSSHQIDLPERGFSFMLNGPLDMRMDPSVGPCAADFLASASESEIADVIYKFGEEPKARFIAKIICERRHDSPFLTTRSLAELISSKVRWKKEGRKHPATKTFQALRIYVNQELQELETLLLEGPKVLRIGGILAVITFHSLEDRIVKRSMLRMSGKLSHDRLPRDIALTTKELASHNQALAEIIKPFPETPAESEINQNPRARSAKLRAIRLMKECL
jgi:16S rRNA (cytosine1402-N4)-methyltransferase